MCVFNTLEDKVDTLTLVSLIQYTLFHRTIHTLLGLYFETDTDSVNIEREVTSDLIYHMPALPILELDN